MSFLNTDQIIEIKDKLVTDEKMLSKLYGIKSKEYQFKSIDHSLVDHYIQKGWEIDAEQKTKTKIKKKKVHSKQFEDDMWCQFYELGYRCLNRDENFVLPFGKEPEDKKQIDVIAINQETAFLIECKSSNEPKKAPSYKDEFELIRLRIDGFKKAIQQIFGREIKVKYIFATRNLRLMGDSEDMNRLEKAKVFYYNDNTYKYINMLIKNYQSAAHYQFLGLVFKNETINNNRIEIPALQGKMGNKAYYMFSIEPSLLLKIGFILHRTKANEDESPTYQRLLIPKRLKGITKFIDDGGYFPNSLIVNFSNKKNIQFEPSSRAGDSESRFGILKIPNEYATAYIIDGQHRLYAYANSKFKENNTIPVVALVGLDSIDQLNIFMDINQNQKAVSSSLRGVLEEDLHWNSDRADIRLKALRSAITRQLGVKSDSPLYNKISIGEDNALLTFQPFLNALSKSYLLPIAKGNKYDEESTLSCLYNIHNADYHQEMENTKKKVVEFIILCYDYVESNYPDIFKREKYFIVSNRGTYAFITLIGSLNSYLTQKKELSIQSSPKERFLAIEKYLYCLMEALKNLSQAEEEHQLGLLGSTADVKWLRFFQSKINVMFPDYNPKELQEWKEKQNEELQDEGRKYGEDIEKYMKKTILEKLKILYGDKWELEIGSIKRECVERALLEDEKNHKDGLNIEDTDWKGMFTINDYKTIIEKHWAKKIDDISFQTFEQEFSIDIGLGFNSKADKLKWIAQFNSYRNLWAHAGTKEKRLNKEEVEFLAKIHKYFYDK